MALVRSRRSRSATSSARSPSGRPRHLVAYANASGDQNPIHQDEAFARSVGLPDVIAHGMWTMGASATVVTDWAGDAGRVVEFGTRFTKPVVVPVAATSWSCRASSRRSTPRPVG